VLDISAILAIVFDEPERGAFASRLEAADRRRLSAASVVEPAMIVESRLGAEGTRALDEVLSISGTGVEAVETPQVYGAREAFRRVGNRRHPAGLTSATVARMRSRKPSPSRCC
jgi:ribonuclease VapC